MTQKTPQNQTGPWPDDDLVAVVKCRPPQYRVSFVVAMHRKGMITDGELAFVSYVFGLGIRLT